MTSEQVMLAVAVLLVSGCVYPRRETEQSLSPFDERQVWAVLPMRNESGSMNADKLLVSDQIARQLENVPNLDTLSVNRVLATMQSLGMEAVATPADAMAVLNALGADGLVAGVITSFDPYDPPKLGLTLELYTRRKTGGSAALDIRALSTAATAESSGGLPSTAQKQPVATAGGYFDAADPPTRELLEFYAEDRGPRPNDHAATLHRINMDLFSEFVCYVMCQRLLYAKTQQMASATPQVR